MGTFKWIILGWVVGVEGEEEKTGERYLLKSSFACSIMKRKLMAYDLNNWDKLTGYQRDSVCYNQKLSSSFITKHWSKLAEYQRNDVCFYQKLPLTFITKHWSKLTGFQRECVCKYQKLSLFFIQKHWSKLTGFQRECVCYRQKLPVTFIQKHWSELTEYQREWVCIYQDYTPTSDIINPALDIVYKETLPKKPKLTRWPRLIDMSFGDF